MELNYWYLIAMCLKNNLKQRYLTFTSPQQKKIVFLLKPFAMNIEDLRNYCIAKKGVTESFPFDNVTLVFKVMDKIFALTNTEGEFTINLKCKPELAIELREKYPCVMPGYHMNKQHWNTVNIDNSVSDKLIYQWIDHSYDLIVQSLTVARRNGIIDLK